MKVIKKIRPGCYGVLIKDNKIALVRKAGGGYTGKLDLPGGGIEYKESPEETLVREFKEETGVTLTSFKLLDATSACVYWEMEKDLYEDLHQIGILYMVETNETNLKKDADGLDSNGANWYKIEELKKEELTPLTIHALEKLNYKLK